MLLKEQGWTAVLGAGVLLVGVLSLWPVLFPAPRLPAVTRVTLPPVSGAQPGRAPEYPTTSNITPLISGRLNLNIASMEQLEALPKVGPALAQRIVEGRPYHSLADLDRVKGVGPGTLKVLEPLVSF
ncbi:helix-hairpin-helix domain-containing protein [Deinococcus deserti]|uniref:Putative Competence protein ComEA n=1 Tax=Deinococcus deserti (strain DSM 17065 / CIP 109153 / LMG 22923 / VCD115) TaxID=546414 RepID=C1CZV8_DEIDV|nr:helix-hairpin-helix domain-containing protein [Deinococcus deserti]ACO45210.1 putative Competence protein ComEA [Deinococcus deserti VCD115]